MAQGAAADAGGAAANASTFDNCTHRAIQIGSPYSFEESLFHVSQTDHLF
ncbi:hypothetical protein SAMN04488036_101750 [Shimia haliotis]|uniref:Uncharacterized protein n=1 Tax=Shimia haliotis TaxID=1280847 RepID=A0A1I4B200_9RHOB|nr:hypothetical protein SAMN04488036_101750 [Shimia haliotis]